MKPTERAVRPLTLKPQATEVVREPGRRSRCRIVADGASTSGLHSEMGALLHHRLRVVCLIALLPALLFLIRNILEAPGPWPVHLQVALALHAGVVLVLGVVAWMLWQCGPLELAVLRRLEMMLFGVLAAFFGYQQFRLFAHDPVSHGAPACSTDLVRLVVLGTAVRWFFLVVIYGVFVPNTWRRCAVVVGVCTALPLILTPAGALARGLPLSMLHPALLDLLTLLLTAAAVAVFGSHRLQYLQRQAFAARMLGQYRLKEKLGQGGMGEVYLAEHVLLRRPCAIKLIRPETAGDGPNLERFEREVQAMATLTHWNTVEVFDYGHADDGTFYYVMEYLPGLNLETLVARHGPVPAGRAIHFLRQVCLALREAHGVGLLHRDIKPSNIIACERGGVDDVAKLLDFGLVAPAGLGEDAMRLTAHGTILGSPPYMSPEQAAGQHDLDARSDIYSVGAVAYFLLTGQPPFQRDTAMQMLLAHAYEPAVPVRDLRPEIPLDLEGVVLRCLAKKREQRYPDVVTLEKALAACADAGAWTEEQAAAWWKARGAQVETDQHTALTATSS